MLSLTAWMQWPQQEKIICDCFSQVVFDSIILRLPTSGAENCPPMIESKVGTLAGFLSSQRRSGQPASKSAVCDVNDAFARLQTP